MTRLVPPAMWGQLLRTVEQRVLSLAFVPTMQLAVPLEFSRFPVAFPISSLTRPLQLSVILAIAKADH
jgi:hypothetical protein